MNHDIISYSNNGGKRKRADFCPFFYRLYAYHQGVSLPSTCTPMDEVGFFDAFKRSYEFLVQYISAMQSYPLNIYRRLFMWPRMTRRLFMWPRMTRRLFICRPTHIGPVVVLSTSNSPYCGIVLYKQILYIYILTSEQSYCGLSRTVFIITLCTPNHPLNFIIPL